jgi:tRNA threonylcarbamoyladenosine biosynthesis protein TsaB
VIVLGIETSSVHGGVALVGTEGLIAEQVLNLEVTYSERLLPAIDRVLADVGLTAAELGGLAVAIGPGSFTGLRIGLSTAKGLAAASGVPLVGVPTLPALAWSLPFCRYPICPILDARKGEVYCALFRWEQASLVQVLEDVAVRPRLLAESITEPTVFVGDGVAAYGDVLTQVLGSRAIFPPPPLRGARPAATAALGRERLMRGERDDPSGLVPRYLRPSEAELKRAAATAGQASTRESGS